MTPSAHPEYRIGSNPSDLGVNSGEAQNAWNPSDRVFPESSSNRCVVADARIMPSRRPETAQGTGSYGDELSFAIDSLDSAIHITELWKSLSEAGCSSDVAFKMPRGVINGMTAPCDWVLDVVVNILLGIPSPVHTDRASVLGLDAASHNHLPRLGYIPNDLRAFSDLSIRENLEFFSGITDVDMDSAMRFLAKLPATIPILKQLDAKVRLLGPDMRMRTSFACALVHGPELLILDRCLPTPDVDIDTDVWATIEYLKSTNRTVLVIASSSDNLIGCEFSTIIGRAEDSEVEVGVGDAPQACELCHRRVKNRAEG